MVAVGNIKKITKAMKMVASAKLRRCEEALNVSRAFARGLQDLWPEGTVAAKKTESTGTTTTTTTTATEGTTGGPAPNSVLLVAVTPDRGLCGSVSGTVNRAAKARFAALSSQGKTVSIVAIGEKARAGLDRQYGRNFSATIADHSKLKRRTFKQSAAIVETILSQQFEQGELVFNQFKNLITFDSLNQPLLNYQSAIADNPAFEVYNTEGNPDLLANLYEYSIATRVNAILADTDMVEYSQRVNAMGNSSKSAEDMLSRLKLLYNRSRQSRITTELIEIISGASAADDQKKKQ